MGIDRVVVCDSCGNRQNAWDEVVYMRVRDSRVICQPCISKRASQDVQELLRDFRAKFDALLKLVEKGD